MKGGWVRWGIGAALVLVVLVGAGCGGGGDSSGPELPAPEDPRSPDEPNSPDEPSDPGDPAPPQVPDSPGGEAAVWQRTNPGGGGAFNTIGGGPTGILLAASDLSGAYLSRDRGRSWEVIGAARGLTVTHVSGIGFDPAEAAVMYLGTEAGLFRSADGGRRWSPVLEHGYITDIAIAPSDPAVGYAAHHSRFDTADGRVYRTDDRGRSWSRVSGPSLPGGLHILELLVDPTDADVVYLLAGEGRFACGPAALYQSTDGGVRWRRLAPALGQVAHVALDPHDPHTLYLTTYGDVWDPGYDCVRDDPQGGHLYRGRWRDGSWNWTRLTGDEDPGRRNLWVWPDADDARALRVIDMDYPWIWESTDGGESWVFLGGKDDWDTGWTGVEAAYGASFNGDVKTLGFDLSDPDALLWVDGQFLWATRDDGRSFGPLFTDEVRPGWWRSRGADNVVPFDLAFGADPDHVYLALADMGCFRSEDGGQSWRNCNDPASVGSWNGHGGNSITVAADPERPGVVWITQANEMEDTHTLLRSSDHGATWTPVGAGLPDGIPSGLSVDPLSARERRTLFITVDGDVYRSRDDGHTWVLVLDCDGCRYTAVHGDRVYAGGEAGLWRSTSGGDPGTWTASGLPQMRGRLGGEFWNVYWEGVAAIRFDPADPQRVYVAAFGAGKGIYRSLDAGQSWERILAGDFLWDVAVAPFDSEQIFAASSSALYSGGYDAGSRGVLRSTDGGRSWTPFNEGLAWPFATRLRFEPQPPHVLWLASPGTGYHRRTLADAVP